MMTKTELRKLIAQKKNSHTEEELKKISETILTKLEQLPLFTKAKTVLLYHSLPDEVFTHEFIAKWSKEKTIILPTVIEGNIILREFTDKENMCVGKYGIKESTGRFFEDHKKIDLAIVPGVAFDLKGNRLGRGKGYYDRLLPHLNCHKVGLCFPFQLVEEIPTELHDICMDAIATN